MQNKSYNIIITGVGGQGVISLAKIIAQAALNSGFDVKMSEIHGLAQRGGHLETHVRIGKKIYSPLISFQGADLVIAFEPLEILRCLYYISDKTQLVINTSKIIPISSYIDKKEYPELKEITEQLKNSTKKIFQIDAVEKIKKIVKTTVPLNIFMLGLVYYKRFLPLSRIKILKSIKTVISEKYFEINKKIFDFSKLCLK